MLPEWGKFLVSGRRKVGCFGFFVPVETCMTYINLVDFNFHLTIVGFWAKWVLLHLKRSDSMFMDAGLSLSLNCFCGTLGGIAKRVVEFDVRCLPRL